MRQFRINNNTCSLYISQKEILQIKQKEAKPQDIVFTSIVNNLIENGQAQIVSNNIEFDLDILYDILDSDDLVGLNIPKFSNLILYIRGNGNHNLRSFCFDYEFYDYFPHGNKVQPVLENGILINGNQRSLLSKNQYQVLELIQKHTLLNNEDKTQEVNLLYLSKIKECSKTSSVILDSYLENEDVIVPDKLK